MAGQQFIVPANSLYLGMSTAKTTPGETDVIRLTGLLPTFAARSTANTKAFSFPYTDVGYATIEPVCSPVGYCRTNPIALTSRNPATAMQPVFIQTVASHPAPSGLDYLGDIASVAADRTTVEGADRHVYKTTSGDEFILCHTDQSAVSPSCEHTFTWQDLRIDLRYKRPWLNDWVEIRANAIALIGQMRNAEVPPNVIHLVDRAPLTAAETQ